VVDRMKRRAIKRGLDRMKKRHGRSVKNIAIDETSFQKRHNYSTIVTDADRGTVLAVLPERDADTVVGFFQNQQFSDFSKLQSIAMDMAPPYIKAIRDFFPQADSLICFDRFHVAQLFNRALDTVRRRESARYRKGENPFVRTRFDWLRNSGKTDNRTSRRRRFLALTRQAFQTSKAWRLKEQASRMWDYKQEGRAEKAWLNLTRRLTHSCIPELKKLGKTIKRHLTGILNAIKLRVNSGKAEARNGCIQRIKRMACGFRDKARFGLEILFQYGGLNTAY